MLKFKSVSIAGPKHLNQDVILEPISTSGRTVCAIADGVGSSKLGGEAAQAAIRAVQLSAAEDSMDEIFQRARAAVIKRAEETSIGQNISTTLTVLSIKDRTATVGHVGDTRVTHLRNQGVTARTQDQTEVQKLIDEGVLSKHQAARYPRRNVLLSAISQKREYTLYTNKFGLMEKDRIILTSDGFHSKILRREILNNSVLHPNFDDFWDYLMLQIRSIDLDDDASCLAIEI